MWVLFATDFEILAFFMNLKSNSAGIIFSYCHTVQGILAHLSVNIKRILHYIFSLRIYSESVTTDRSLVIRVLMQVLCNKDPLTLTYGVYLAQLFPRNDPFKVLRSNSGRICKDVVRTEAEFLDEIQSKVSKSFSPCYSKSPLQLCLEISTSSNSRNLLQFLLDTVQEKGGKPDRKPYPLPYGLINL